MTLPTVLRLPGGLLSTFLLCSCALHSDGDYRQDLTQHLPDLSVEQAAAPEQQLTDLMADPLLQQAVQQALSANPDIQQLYWQWQQSLASVSQRQGERLPEVEAQLQRQHKAGEQVDSAAASLRVSWQLDIWMQLADQAEAAEQRALQQQALLHAGRASLAADVMDAWLAIVHAQKQWQVEQQRQALLQQNESFVRQRYRRGLGELEDLDNVATELTQSQARLAQYQSELKQQQYRLRRLLGASSGELASPDTFPQVGLVLTQMAQQTLAQRPDLRAAYAAIAAAESDVDVAYKDLLPSLSLEAALTGQDGNFGLSDPVWSLLGQLVAPILNAGQRQAKADSAEAKAGELYAAYQSTLLTAVQEVDNAVESERSLLRQQQQLQQALASAQRTVAQYQYKYRNGLVSILDLLNTQQQAFDLELQLNTTIYQHLSNRITLGLALGLGVSQ